MKNYEYFAQLGEKGKLSKAEKSDIRAAAAGLSITINENCSNCWADAAMQIAIALKPKEQQTEGAYELWPGIDITIDSYKYGRLHVCAKECTEANVKLWLAAGLPKSYFKSLPSE